MYDELINGLREDAEWAESNVWYAPITLSDHLKQAADAIEVLSKVEKTTQWIPVAERLPIFDKVVQITDGINVGHGYLEGVRSTAGVVYMWQSPFCDIDEEHITHWMPLPEPPKEET